jgi:hypothetical protein
VQAAQADKGGEKQKENRGKSMIDQCVNLYCKSSGGEEIVD